MTIAKEVVYALHQRLKDLSVNATSDQLAYLAKALESIAGQSTVLDIVNMTDEKLEELLNAATNHLQSLDTSKANTLKAISDSEKESLKKINDQELKSLSLLDTRKDANIAAINSTADLGTIKNTLKTINDLPNGSSIMKEVKNRNMIEPGSLPFLFGVLNRYNDNWGSGNFSSELSGQWYNSIAGANYMLSRLAGSHTESTNYCSFYRPPQLHFLQSTKGTFLYKEMYLRYAVSTNEYSYPYALLGVIFVKNTTNADITRTINFTGASGWNSGYEGAGMFVGTPNNTNTNKANISAVTWVNVYNHNSISTELSGSGSVVIPAEKTVAIILYTSSYYYTNSNSYYVQFMYWSIYNFRSNFLTEGLEVDVERTLRAWQCPGLDATYKIWN